MSATIRKGSKVKITDEHGAWIGYITGSDPDVYFVSESPRGFEPICIDKANVTPA